MNQTNYWIPVEEQWRQENVQLLQPHLDCTRRTHDWIARLATHGGIVKTQVGEVLGVSRMLLRRLGEELRAVELLAQGGHGFQSATTACNLFEQSHFLTYVGIGIANANKFIGWTEPQKSIINVKMLVDECRR